MKNENTAKKHAAHGFSQFRLTNNLLQNLNKFEITPTAKLVLLYLSGCYNPKKTDMFPKQRTIAAKLGISEASVIRAVSELHKGGLIISERKYSNRYKFTSKIVSQAPEIEKNFTPDILQDENSQNETLESCNLQPHDKEPMKEPIKEPVSVDDYKVLREYAISKGAKNVQKYVEALKNNGADKRILKEHYAQKAIKQFNENKIKDTKLLIAKYQSMRCDDNPKDCTLLKEVLNKNWGIIKQ